MTGSPEDALGWRLTGRDSSAAFEPPGRCQTALWRTRIVHPLGDFPHPNAASLRFPSSRTRSRLSQTDTGAPRGCNRRPLHSPLSAASSTRVTDKTAKRDRCRREFLQGHARASSASTRLPSRPPRSIREVLARLTLPLSRCLRLPPGQVVLLSIRVLRLQTPQVKSQHRNAIASIRTSLPNSPPRPCTSASSPPPPLPPPPHYPQSQMR